MNQYKIVITGTMGVGKTTAIAAISEIEPINTDVQNNDSSVVKLRTTVGFDYGEITLDNQDKLRLYGTPGQARFAFMWKVLVHGALGLIILVDNSRPDPLADLDIYLDNFASLIDESACVIGVCRTDSSETPTMDDYSEHLALRTRLCPVIAVDVRVREDVLLLIDLLLTQLENRV